MDESFQFCTSDGVGRICLEASVTYSLYKGSLEVIEIDRPMSQYTVIFQCCPKRAAAGLRICAMVVYGQCS